MTPRIRTLTAAAAAALLLAACGSTADGPTSTESAPGQGAVEDDSEAWPLVEDENGELETNPQGAEGAPYDNGEVSDFPDGNETTVEICGETRDLDMDALLSGTWDLESQYFAESMTGAKYLIELNADGPEDLEAYREKTGTAPVSYVRIDIDNTEGMSDASASDLILVDSDGTEFHYETAFIAMDEWGPSMHDDGPKDENDGYYYALADGTKISEEEYTPLQNDGVELYNELLDTSASPRAKQTIWLIGDEEPSSMEYFGLGDGSEPLYAMPLLP